MNPNPPQFVPRSANPRRAIARTVTARRSVAQARPSSGLRTRTCIGCRARDEAQLMVRVSVSAARLVVDLGNKASGRGAWLHASRRCLGLACKGGLLRALGHTISALQLTHQLHEVASLRAASLLSAAAQAKQVVTGTTCVASAEHLDRSALVIMAADCALEDRTGFLGNGIFGSGHARIWGNKQLLGTLTGGAPLDVLSVMDRGLGRALMRCVDLTQVPLPGAEILESRSMEVL